MHKFNKKYADMKPEDMRVLLEQKDKQISLLELNLKKAENLTKLANNAKSLKKRIAPSLSKNFKSGRAGDRPETN